MNSITYKPLSLRICLSFAVSLLIVAALSPAQALSLGQGQLPDFTSLVEKVSPTVVNISTTQKKNRPSVRMPQGPQGTPFDDFFRKFFEENQGGGGEYEAESLGSGFIISADGYILTNHHVVHEADEIIVKLSDRRELSAELIGSDERSDLALLKIEANNLPFVEYAKQPLKVGEWVLAIGSPYGFEATVTQGIVSAKGRVLRGQQYVPLIQTDVAINPGNSGGPLFNLKGEVVGINSMIYSGTGGYMGLSFSIPVSLAESVVKQLRETGQVTRGWLGVLLQEVDRELAEVFGLDKPQGAAVRKVFPGSPAEKAGLQVEDVILSYNGQPVPDVDALPPLVGATPAGDTVLIKVNRNGKTVNLDVKIAALDEDKVNSIELGGKNKPKLPKIGLEVQELSDEEREQLELETGGVKVTVVNSGAAKDAGIRQNDIILKIDGELVSDTANLRKRINDAEPGKLVRLYVVRRGTPLFMAMRIPES